MTLNLAFYGDYDGVSRWVKTEKRLINKMFDQDLSKCPQLFCVLQNFF